MKVADFGDTDPLLEHNDHDDDDDDDDDDKDEGNTITPFKPDYNSTPGPSGEDIPKTRMNTGKEKAPETAETSLIEGDTSYSQVFI